MVLFGGMASLYQRGALRRYGSLFCFGALRAGRLSLILVLSTRLDRSRSLVHSMETAHCSNLALSCRLGSHITLGALTGNRARSAIVVLSRKWTRSISLALSCHRARSHTWGALGGSGSLTTVWCSRKVGLAHVLRCSCGGVARSSTLVLSDGPAGTRVVSRRICAA